MYPLCFKCPRDSVKLAYAPCSVCGKDICRECAEKINGKDAIICKGCLASRREIGAKIKTRKLKKLRRSRFVY